MTQVTLALVLLVGSGLMIRTVQALRDMHPGFVRASEVQIVRLSVPDAELADPESVFRLFHQVRDRLAAIPGVTDVAFTTAAPLKEDAPTRSLPLRR